MKIWPIILLFTFFQSNNRDHEINWIQFDEFQEVYRKEAKPVIIFIHTDWCKYCKMQLNTTFKDSNIIESLSNSYYCIQLNAESKDSIKFLNKTYKGYSNNGYHELATFLGSKKGKITFPTTVILNQQLEAQKQIDSYIDTDFFKKLLQ